MTLCRTVVCLVVLSFVSLAGAAEKAVKPPVPAGLKVERSLPSRYPYVVEDALRLCQPQPGFWVDLGAGRGQVALALLEKVPNPVLMIDPDKEAMAQGLQLARDKGWQGRLFAVAGCAEDLPLLDNSVDLLVSRGSIFFWDDPAQGLKEVYRVLRPGGKAYIGGGAGSGYPAEAVKKLIQNRKRRVQGPEGERWKHFNEMRRPELMRRWAEAAQLKNYRVLGQGAVSAQDAEVGQGVWLLFGKD